ncbi:MAG: hypothetical protein KDC80_02940, partial [Saprospiraceae bacterium]|nr:hypothetical protein [Saprospiraceae bacterium]
MKFLRHSKNYLLPILLLNLILISCQKKDSDILIGTTGTIEIKITDAPIDNNEVRNAYISISG